MCILALEISSIAIKLDQLQKDGYNGYEICFLRNI
jgi:hypothetical protein